MSRDFAVRCLYPSVGVIAMLILNACGGGEPASAPPAAPVAPSAAEAPPPSPPPDTELARAIQDPLDRAKAVEGALEKDRAALDEAIDKQTSTPETN